ncbi:FMN adenylyltransferase /riboflavin kinase [Arboricoccus pini]|uniref:Riboflavin biosynthesis protein n=1 Tax=Arboricoccus pini TaxID=1963835 RepID=A0A212Q4D9_9PROT|nr:bifunctional riboflavin kinase/FAD synthetase [Arboricoccus pini]SNB54139.1 FMN adenylyltransferase /riboflavin kinase [Arboricoccus pini]
MQIHRRFAALPGNARGASLALGNFDGVHIGHRAVIAAAGEAARRLGVPLGVLTFEPHPREVLAPERAPARLTTFARKVRLMEELGVEQLIALPFDHRLMSQAPEAFAKEILVDLLSIRAAAAGHDFCFGHRRSGDMAQLSTLGRQMGFAVQSVHGVELDGQLASSTLIRKLLLAGNLADANALLGANFCTGGIVVHGDARGRELGYPTANIQAVGRKTLLPANGIYAVRAGVQWPDGLLWYDGVCSLGTRPTFDGNDRRLEVNILDGRYDLYGLRMKVEFVARLRGEEYFADIDALIQQMARDCANARAALCAAPPSLGTGKGRIIAG